MRFTTNDGSFGFIIQSTDTRGFFEFRIVIGGHALGNRGMTAVAGAIGRLKRVADMGDVAALTPGSDAFSMLAALMAEDARYDPTMLNVTESLDSWSIRFYSHGVTVVFLAVSADHSEGSPWMAHSEISREEYGEVLEHVVSYYENAIRV